MKRHDTTVETGDVTRPGGRGRQGHRALGRPLAALLGVLLMALGAIGWWLTTRVLDAHGFADVVAKSSQRQEVRDYIADQATLRLARTSNFVSAARPIVTDALSAAIATPPVDRGDPRLRRARPRADLPASGARRVNVDSAGGGGHRPQRARDDQPRAREQAARRTC